MNIYARQPDVKVCFYNTNRGEFSPIVDDAFNRHLAKITKIAKNVQVKITSFRVLRSYKISARFPLWYD